MSKSSYLRKTLWGIVLMGFIALPVQAQEKQLSVDVDAEVLVRQIFESIEKGDLEQADVLTRKLGKVGENAVVAIRKSLMAQAQMRTMLTFALGQIVSDNSTDALLQNADFERDNAGQSLSLLDGRSINRPLTEKELNNLIARVKSDNGWRAGVAARLLSKSSFNDVETRAQPVVLRFVTELAAQRTVTSRRDSEALERVSRLNQFLFAFARFNDPKVVALLQQQIKGQSDPFVLSWLNIALGFSGDDSVAAKLRNIVIQEKDASTKTVALRAYCRVAEFASLPLLRTIIIDQIKEYGPNSRNILLMTAENEVSRLRSLPGFPTTIPTDTEDGE